VQQVCPDGKLNRTQFVDLYKRMFPGGKSAAFYQHLFRVYDADHSGKLEFPEFIQVSYYMSVAVILNVPAYIRSTCNLLISQLILFQCLRSDVNPFTADSVKALYFAILV